MSWGEQGGLAFLIRMQHAVPCRRIMPFHPAGRTGGGQPRKSAPSRVTVPINFAASKLIWPPLSSVASKVTFPPRALPPTWV